MTDKGPFISVCNPTNEIFNEGTSTAKSRFGVPPFFSIWDSYPLHRLILPSVNGRGSIVQKSQVLVGMVWAEAVVTIGGFHFSLVVLVDVTSHSKLE